MTDRILFFIALFFLAGFLGILAWKVPRWDLIAVLGIALALALWDFISTVRSGIERRRGIPRNLPGTRG